jgi:hypothetical protein
MEMEMKNFIKKVSKANIDFSANNFNNFFSLQAEDFITKFEAIDAIQLGSFKENQDEMQIDKLYQSL